MTRDTYVVKTRVELYHLWLSLFMGKEFEGSMVPASKSVASKSDRGMIEATLPPFRGEHWPGKPHTGRCTSLRTESGRVVGRSGHRLPPSMTPATNSDCTLVLSICGRTRLTLALDGMTWIWQKLRLATL